jgi:hypothetical protein
VPEQPPKEAAGTHGLGDALRSGQVWLLGLIYLILLGAGFGLIFFVPDFDQGPNQLQRLRGGSPSSYPVRDSHSDDADCRPPSRPGPEPAALPDRPGTLRRARHRLTAQAQSPLLLADSGDHNRRRRPPLSRGGLLGPTDGLP